LLVALNFVPLPPKLIVFPLYRLELTQYWYFIFAANDVVPCSFSPSSIPDSIITPLYVGHNLLALPNNMPLMAGIINHIPATKKIIEKSIFIVFSL